MNTANKLCIAKENKILRGGHSFFEMCKSNKCTMYEQDCTNPKIKLGII